MSYQKKRKKKKIYILKVESIKCTSDMLAVVFTTRSIIFPQDYYRS